MCVLHGEREGWVRRTWRKGRRGGRSEESDWERNRGEVGWPVDGERGGGGGGGGGRRTWRKGRRGLREGKKRSEEKD